MRVYGPSGQLQAHFLLSEVGLSVEDSTLWQLLCSALPLETQQQQQEQPPPQQGLWVLSGGRRLGGSDWERTLQELQLGDGSTLYVRVDARRCGACAFPYTQHTPDPDTGAHTCRHT